MDKDRTASQKPYAAWLMAECEANGLRLKSEADRDAFRLAAMLGSHCYGIYQQSQRDARAEAVESTPEPEAAPP
jgi:hypothetical protein